MALVGNMVAAMLLTAHLDGKQISQKCDTCIRAFQVLLCRYEFKFHLLNSATLSSSTFLGSVYTFETQQRFIALSFGNATSDDVGRDSVVGIATWYGSDCPDIKSRFSAPVPTGPEVHSASYTMDTRSHSSRHSGQDVVMTTQPHLTPKSEKE
jgi:hypothetical protein